jgi:hypothetical protein
MLKGKANELGTYECRWNNSRGEVRHRNFDVSVKLDLDASKSDDIFPHFSSFHHFNNRMNQNKFPPRAQSAFSSLITILVISMKISGLVL